MVCKICGSRKCKKEYEGIIRDGGLGRYTKAPVTLWKCCECDVIWHEKTFDISNYYETPEYRLLLEKSSDPLMFYALHDKECKWKFDIAGTEIFREKTVMDVGSGGGGIIDFIRGVANEVIAVEPSEVYRSEMEKRGITTFAYTKDAINQGLKEKIDLIVSFDVLEHVEAPLDLVSEIYCLLKKSGTAIIGTPTDAPIMRELLGEDYEMKQLFSTQHLWVFGEKNLKYLAEKAGCNSYSIRYYQRYGFDNFLGWLKDKKPKAEIKCSWINRNLDMAWKGFLEDSGLADYIVLYLHKS